MEGSCLAPTIWRRPTGHSVGEKLAPAALPENRGCRRHGWGGRHGGMPEPAAQVLDQPGGGIDAPQEGEHQEQGREDRQEEGDHRISTSTSARGASNRDALPDTSSVHSPGTPSAASGAV
jgi:hypothetical protein